MQPLSPPPSNEILRKKWEYTVKCFANGIYGPLISDDYRLRRIYGDRNKMRAKDAIKHTPVAR
jgi:hypothetical protein